MSVLLDTNAFVWALGNPSRLTSAAREAILSVGQPKLLSSITTYELSQKVHVKKLELPVPPSEFVRRGMESLGLTALGLLHRHTASSDSLAWHHRDPFDRLLALQATVEGLAIISSDEQFDRYGVRRIW